MILRKLSHRRKTKFRVISPDEKWESTRLLLKDDNMGFSFHITTIYKGMELPMHYKNHLEAVYCISGKGEIEDLASGNRHTIKPGVIYALDDHDPHILRCLEEMELACVFNPPLRGDEVHNKQGSYDIDA